MKRIMEAWKLATILAIGVAADTYLEALTHSQSGGSLPPPGVVYTEPTPQPQFPVNYQPPPQSWSLPYNLKFDPGSIIPIGLSIVTILKLVLKIVIFKMIVKFMAVLCLLLVIPALQKTPEMTTTTTIKPTDETTAKGREFMIEAATTKPLFCEDGDWPCYFWQTVANTFPSTEKSSRKRRQISSRKNRRGSLKVKRK